MSHAIECPFQEYSFVPFVDQGGSFESHNTTQGTNRNLLLQLLFDAAGVFAGNITVQIRRLNPATGQYFLSTNTDIAFTGPTVNGQNVSVPLAILGGCTQVVLRNGVAGAITNVSLRLWEQPTPVQGRNNSNVQNAPAGFCYKDAR